MARRVSPPQSSAPGVLIHLDGLPPTDHAQEAAPWQDASFLPMGAPACAVPDPDEFEQRYDRETLVSSLRRMRNLNFHKLIGIGGNEAPVGADLSACCGSSN